MNIARPGASVGIDPAVRDGVPTILGTEVTTLDAMERTMAFPYEETKNATRLGITVTQLQVASLCAGPRRLQPTGKLQFTGGLRKLYIGTDPALLHETPHCCTRPRTAARDPALLHETPHCCTRPRTAARFDRQRGNMEIPPAS